MKPFACDSVLIENGKVLLIRRAFEPFKGEWAFPGGHLDEGETEEECARREMKEEAGLNVEPIKLIGYYSHPAWGSKKSAAYLVKRIGGELKAGTDASEVAWYPLSSVPKLCADHGQILADAVRKMKNEGDTPQ